MTESFEVQRLVGSVHAVSDDTESEMHRLDYLVDRLVASAAPAVTFTSLAEACVPLLGPRCIVDLVEDSGVAYSIERPRGSMSKLPGERGGADRCTVSAAAVPGEAECEPARIRHRLTSPKSAVPKSKLISTS